MVQEINTDMHTRVLADVNQREQEAYKEVLEKRERYENAMSLFTRIQNKLNQARLALESSNQSGKSDAQSAYNKLYKQSQNADIDVSVFRSSLLSSASYHRKVNNSAMLANSILG